MDAKQIKQMGRKLKAFWAHFDDCFSHSEPRQDLLAYVTGQLSDLPRKSIEPIALASGMAPQTLQFFLSDIPWDHTRLRDRLQWQVASDHSHSLAIGVIDESGNPKKGTTLAASSVNGAATPARLTTLSSASIWVCG